MLLLKSLKNPIENEKISDNETKKYDIKKRNE
jgi:hypothetical protein